MKASCTSENLLVGLKTVSRSVAPASSLSVLANVLVEASGSSLKLAANNLETCTTISIDAAVDVAGAVTVPARLFTELVSTLPKDRVELSLDEGTQTLSVHCVGFSATLKGIDAEEFPMCPEFGTEGSTIVRLSPAEAKTAIRLVASAAATDESRPVLTGVQMTVSDSDMKFSAADGFRLAVKTIPLWELAGPDEQISVIVPVKSLLDLSRLIVTDDPVGVAVSENVITFKIGYVTMSSQLIAGTFPDFSGIIPTTYTTRIEVPAAELAGPVRVSHLFARDNANILKFSADPEAQSMSLVATSAETGDYNTDVVCGITGPQIDIAFNSKYVMDVLSMMNGASIHFDLNSSSTPGTIRIVDDPSFTFVVMPMDLNRK